MGIVRPEAEHLKTFEQLGMRGPDVAIGLVAGVLAGAHGRNNKVSALAHPIEPLDSDAFTGEMAVKVIQPHHGPPGLRALASKLGQPIGW